MSVFNIPSPFLLSKPALMPGEIYLTREPDQTRQQTFAEEDFAETKKRPHKGKKSNKTKINPLQISKHFLIPALSSGTRFILNVVY